MLGEGRGAGESDGGFQSGAAGNGWFEQIGVPVEEITRTEEQCGGRKLGLELRTVKLYDELKYEFRAGVRKTD